MFETFKINELIENRRLTPNPRVKGGKMGAFLGSGRKKSIRKWLNYYCKYTIGSGVLC